MSAKRAERRRQARSGAAAGPWRGPLPIVGAVVIVAAVIGAFVLLGRGDAEPPPPPVDASAVTRLVTGVPQSTLDAVGLSGAANLKAGASQTLTSASGRPLVIYVGAEWCPFCASERWPLIVALSRFGTFDGLGLTSSSSSDVFPSTPSLTFKGATYRSTYVELSAVETGDREQRPLATPDAQQQASFQRFSPRGSIPYLSLADRYVLVGSGVGPEVFSGKTWQQIGAALADPASPVARAVHRHANEITAAICDLTGGQPAQTCGAPAVRGFTRPQ